MAAVKQRLESLDALRGFDLFCLVALEGIMYPLGDAIHQPWYDSFMWCFTHKTWEGFSSWDLVMPLFMFMSGVSMPYSFAKYKDMPNKYPVYRRIGKRIILLWIFGMMCQGNLLGLDPQKIYLFSNTLQAIAVGYLFTALLYLNVRRSIQIGVAIALLLIYWAAMQFISFDGFGGGNYTADGNLAEGIDRYVLGRFRDQATVVNGVIDYGITYRYTWILSSLTFVVTVLTGLFAGQIIKSQAEGKRKLQLLFGIGAAMVVVGWTWGWVLPVIKHIWTSSMVLVSSGYCFLLMGLFYYWIDYKGHNKNITWLKVYGMNSITAYVIAEVIDFKSIGESLFHGTEAYIGNFYPFLLAVTNALIIYLILWILYKRNIFLRV